MPRLCRANNLLKLYFISVTAALLWILMTYGMWCTSGPYGSDRELFLSLEKREKNIYKLEKSLSKKYSGLQKIERKLKHQFPRQFARISGHVQDDLPWIFLITPTYSRPEQKAELVRLSHTFLHVPKLHWIIIEDSDNKTSLVSNFLRLSGLKYTQLNVRTPAEYKMKSSDPNWLKPRGVLQRNLGIKWLRYNVDIKTEKGVVYFADDDNTYDLKLFEEMRDTKKVSVWPVGLVGGLRFERPIVQHGKVVNWYTGWKKGRTFALDMAGFALNLQLLFDHWDSWFSLEVQRGYQETVLLSKLLITLDDLEPKADNCTKILVWHTRTEKPKLKNEVRLQRLGKPPSDLTVEV